MVFEVFIANQKYYTGCSKACFAWSFYCDKKNMFLFGNESFSMHKTCFFHKKDRLGVEESFEVEPNSVFLFELFSFDKKMFHVSQ